MLGTTASAGGTAYTRSDAPYRTLFHHLAAGAAHCRLLVERGTVAGVEILDRNPAFAPYAATLRDLLDVFGEVYRTGCIVFHELPNHAPPLAVSIYPVTADSGVCDEVMIVFEDETRRRQLERSSRESQGRFQQAFHGNAAAMVISQQTDLRILDVNPRWLEMFGATRDQVIGKTATELGTISQAHAEQRIAEHRQFREGYDTELELRTLAGARIIVLASARPIELREGRCLLTTLIDITARKNAEQAFATVFEASPAGMVLVDALSDEIVGVNERMLELTRRTRDSFIGRQSNGLGLVVTPTREALLAEMVRAGRLDGVEVQLARAGGSPVWALASAQTLQLHGRPHRLSVFTDITARKRHERRLQTKHEIGRFLAETSELELAIPSMLEALCLGEGWESGAVWLTEGTELRCRGAWGAPHVARSLATVVRQLEIPGDGLLGRVAATGAAEIIALDPAASPFSAAAILAGLRHAIAFPVLRGSTVLGVIAVAGREHAALDPAERGMLDSIGRLLGLYVERARAETALRELNLELERRVLERTHALETSNRDLEAFSSSVSHDLRAPLRAIHGFSAILLEDFGDVLPAEAKELAGRINASGSRLRTLVEQLLTHARLGRDRLNLQTVDLDALVRSVLDELLVGRELGDRLALTVHPLGTCRADPALLRSVWVNLIDNALKYARDQPRIEIEIGREAHVGEVAYYVRDNGVGFDMAHASKLFGVFQRLHDAQQFEGTGVGLANVRRIIERHRGRVSASSAVGRGSRFEITLGKEAP